jgi:hypothetical protein
MRNVVNCAVLAVPLLWVACAGSPEGPMRTGVVPLGPKPETEVKKDDGKRAAEDQTPPVIGMGPEAPAEPGFEVSYRTVTQIVEPPPAPASPAAAWSSGTSEPEYQLAGGYPYALVPAYEPRRERETWFPYGTAIGIGIGAAFDHHHGHHGHHHHGGAWLGGTLGLMFDLARWH